MESSLSTLARRLAQHQTSSRQLVEACLDRARDESGEGKRVFRTIGAEAALAAADAIDLARRSGDSLAPYDGIPISAKDLFDIEGEQTLAGSKVLADAPPARQDSDAVARLRKAGFIFVGRTNMTEFAYSGLGLNPHYGTPLNPYDRESGRIPGGSSSGAAVSVTDGMAFAGLGTDTGGSCRIPAAMCGIVGFKPTARRISREGVATLSDSLDSVGSLANTVACCASIDAVLSGEPDEIIVPSVSGLRFGILLNFVFDDVEDEVANAFERAANLLSSAGASVSDIEIAALHELPLINSKGGFAAAESFWRHRELLAASGGDYDPRVISRIRKGAEQSAADYLDLLAHRRRLIGAADMATEGFDAVLYPTVPVTAPRLASLADDGDYYRINALVLRNPFVTNFLDRCAVSIPIHLRGDAPVGMNVMGRALQDRELLGIAAALEGLLAGRSSHHNQRLARTRKR